MTTVIYNCKHCKMGRRVDYPLGSSGSGAHRINSEGKQIPAGVYITRCGGGKPTEYGGDVEFGICSTCHKMMSFGALKGYYSEQHICDARCMASRGPNCECSCGGKNHGSSWAA
jgi:hypothetical protein